MIRYDLVGRRENGYAVARVEEHSAGAYVKYEIAKELEDLAQMILDAESADESLISIMFHAWLNKAKELLNG